MKCAKCRKDLIKEGGYYPTPEGDFCSECYGRKRKKRKPVSKGNRKTIKQGQEK